MNQEKYIGMDVHTATVSAAVMNAQGKVLTECVMETKASTILGKKLCQCELENCANRHRPSKLLIGSIALMERSRVAGGEGSAMSKRNPCGVPFITPQEFVFPPCVPSRLGNQTEQQAHNPGNQFLIAQIGRV